MLASEATKIRVKELIDKQKKSILACNTIAMRKIGFQFSTRKLVFSKKKQIVFIVVCSHFVNRFACCLVYWLVFSFLFS